MKREALLDCYDTLKSCYGKLWARTSVDLAIEVRLAAVLPMEGDDGFDIRPQPCRNILR